MNINYHTHTYRCKHAEGADEEYVLHAIDNKFQKLGFSDHVPYPFCPDLSSRIRMEVSQTGDYVDSVNSLKVKYRDQIQLLLGYEMEYYKDTFSESIDYLESFGFDFLILSQHFITGESYPDFTGNLTSDKGRLQEYVKIMIEAMETGRFLYAGHPDIINYRDDMQYYKAAVKELCEAAKSLNIPLEYNILGQDEGKCYPYLPFFEIASDVGNQIILGIDAHRPTAFDNQESIRKAKQILSEIGIVPITDL
ncbi:MAG: histidinol-phosphatase [Lachnospiraceae bacterium]